MPFFKSIENQDGIIGVWKLTETPSELISQINLSAGDYESYQKITAIRRQTEFLATRLLLQKLIGRQAEIRYHENRKPYISGSTEKLSISHSIDFVCIFVSDKTVGIDIEQTSRPIDRVADRFLHADEKEHILSLKNQQVVGLLYWSAKEAVFKCSEIQGISFKNQIIIESFNPELSDKFTARLIFPEKTFQYQLTFESFGNNVLVYCVQQ